MKRDRATLAAVQVADLGLPTRVLTVFAAAGIETLADIVTHTEAEIRRLDNLGARSLVAIKQVLIDRGLRFGIEFETYFPGVTPRPAWPPADRPQFQGAAEVGPRRPQSASVPGASLALDRPPGALRSSPPPRPAADLTHGDTRFGFAAAGAGM